MEINELRSTIKGEIPNPKFQAPSKSQFAKFQIQNTMLLKRSFVFAKRGIGRKECTGSW
jgi:hypothetical protein